MIVRFRGARVAPYDETAVAESRFRRHVGSVAWNHQGLTDA